MIEGGYYIKARSIQNSLISVQPPHVREIWDYLLREANHSSVKYAGFHVNRGQLFRTYNEIREGTHWMVGWRKMTYNENQTKKAMKFLREAQMITTKKELGGVLITICNYDYYQNPKNYERTTIDTTERTIEEPLKNQTIPDNNKNVRIKEEEECKKDVIVKYQKEFYNTLSPFLKEFSKETLNEFYAYWTEPNKSKTKIKWQLEKTWDTRKRLLRWVNNDFSKKTNSSTKQGYVKPPIGDPYEGEPIPDYKKSLEYHQKLADSKK